MAIIEVVSTQFAKWLDPEEGDEKTGPGQLLPGDQLEGRLIEYNATEGGKDFNEQVCGIAVLRTPDDEIIHITLDKGRLKTAFQNLTASKYYGGNPLGAYIYITYDGWQEPKQPGGRRYKGFTVQHDPDLREQQTSSSIETL